MKIGILGCGNMASALVEGMLSLSPLPELFLYTPSMIRAESLAKKIKASVCKSIEDFPLCDAYMIACKPHQVEELSKEFLIKQPDFKGVFVSILAGVGTDKLCEFFKSEKIIRLMPNTPAVVGKGVIASFCLNEQIKKEDKDNILNLFSSSSKVYELDSEDLIDVITPYSGSGPAYIFEIARIMTDDLIGRGIDSKMAKSMINETFLGASALMAQSDLSHIDLRNNVTSKNGVTAKALDTFKDLGLEQIVTKGLEEAYKKTLELKN